MAGKMQSVRDELAVSISEEELRERAYYIWQSEGEPDGRDVEHWTQALDEVHLKSNAITTELARAPVSVVV